MTIENQQFLSSLLFGIFTGMFFIAVAPNLFRLFAPHHGDAILPRSAKELIACYIYGTLSILVGGGVTVALIGLWWIILIFFAIACGCGSIVVLRYFSVDFAKNKTQNAIQRQNNPNLRDD